MVQSTNWIEEGRPAVPVWPSHSIADYAGIAENAGIRWLKIESNRNNFGNVWTFDGSSRLPKPIGEFSDIRPENRVNDNIFSNVRYFSLIILSWPVRWHCHHRCHEFCVYLASPHGNERKKVEFCFISILFWNGRQPFFDDVSVSNEIASRPDDNEFSKLIFRSSYQLERFSRVLQIALVHW